MDVKKKIRELKRAGEIRGTYKLKHFIALFTELASIDKHAEKLRKRFGCLTWLMVPLVFFVPMFLIEVNPYLPYALAILAFVGLIVFFIKWRSAKKSDIENDFRLFVLPALRDLADDVAPDGKLSITIPMQKIEQKFHLIETSDKYQKGVYHKCIDYIYRRPYIEFTIPMRDGNLFELSGDVYLKKTKKSKWTPRGKHKTKVKYKKWVVLTISLALNPERYMCDPDKFRGFSSKQEKLAVRHKKGREVVMVRYTDRIDMTSKLTDAASYELLVKELLGIYTMLRVKG